MIMYLYIPIYSEKRYWLYDESLYLLSHYKSYNYELIRVYTTTGLHKIGEGCYEITDFKSWIKRNIK